MIGDMNREFINGSTALFPACRRGHVGIVKELIERGANVNHANRSGETPLVMACRQGRFGVIRALIQSGANVNHINKYGESPLLIVSRRSRHKVIRMLVESGADVNYCDPLNGETPLAIVVNRLSYNWAYDNNINYLVEKSADVNKGVVDLDGDKTNALNLLLKRGYVQMAKLLLRYGALPDKPDSQGNLPLCSALYNLESTKFFLDKFPDAASRPVTTWGTTLLKHVICDLEVPLEVFKYVISRKIVDVVGGKIEGLSKELKICPFLSVEMRRRLRHIVPYLLYERDKQRLTELCKLNFLVEKHRASVVPHVLEKTCNLSPDLFEELSEYMAPRDVVEKPEKSGCACCGYC